MKQLVLLSFLVFFWGGSSLFAQQEMKIQVMDASSHHPIETVSIRLTSSNGNLLFNGVVKNDTILILSNKTTKINCFLEKKGYQPLDTIINVPKKSLSFSIAFPLQFDGVSFQKVDINAAYYPTVKFSSHQLNVSDFVVLNRDTLILLTYPKHLNKYSELVWYVNGTVKNTNKVQGVAVKLQTDYKGRVFLRCKKQDYLVQPRQNMPLSKVSTRELEKYIEPILDTFRNQALFYTTFSAVYPAYDYYQVDLNDTTQNALYHIEDKVMMEQYRAEYKWTDVRTKLWAWDMESKTGIDRKIWVGAQVFTNSIYWEEPYGNLFLSHDTALVFDFYKGLLFHFKINETQPIDSVKIDFQKKARKTGWEKKMLQDPVTKKIYTLYNDGGYIYLYEINRKTGQKGERFTLFYRYPENIQVYNGFVYYIYRPFESIQKKYLYEEKLNNPDHNLKAQQRFENAARKK